MAELFLATDTRTSRFVVLKRILPHLAEESEFHEMFLDEARIASMLHHPVIIEMYDLGHLEGSTYIAMEWVEGVDLRRMLNQELERGGVLPPGIAAWIAARLCEGLNAAHTLKAIDGSPLGIIHRDISPQNVMVTYKGDVKLVDFGIAKATAWVTRSRPGVIKGKFLYLSPEQLDEEPLDSRVDLFALGTLLYELTTGKGPFQRASTEAVIYAVKMENPPPPATLVVGYPQGLSKVIMRCLEKKRDKRIQSADEIRLALEDFMRAEAPTTRADVARYLNGLFGTEDERTSVYVPPNARSQPSGADDDDERTAMAGPPGLTRKPTPPTMPIGRRGLPEGRRPTPDAALAPPTRPEAGAAVRRDDRIRDAMRTMDLPGNPTDEVDTNSGETEPPPEPALAQGSEPALEPVDDPLDDPPPLLLKPRFRPPPPAPSVSQPNQLSIERRREKRPEGPSPSTPSTSSPTESERRPVRRPEVSPATRKPGSFSGKSPSVDPDDFQPTVALADHRPEVSITTPSGRRRKTTALAIGGVALIGGMALAVYAISRPGPMPAGRAPEPVALVKVTLRGSKGTVARVGAREIAMGSTVELPEGGAELVYRCPDKQGRAGAAEQRLALQISPQRDGKALPIDVPCR